MSRNCIKLLNKCVFSSFLKRQSEPLKRTIFTLPRQSILSINYCNVQNQRFKSKNVKKKETSESGSDPYENDNLDEVQDKNTKVLTINVTSLRIDGILKHSLGIARNKIETSIYESKVRLNGNKIPKKSVKIQEGDEIDLIKGPDIKNPNLMNVARVEILSLKGNEENISVKVRRFKSLTVEAYT